MHAAQQLVGDTKMVVPVRGAVLRLHPAGCVSVCRQSCSMGLDGSAVSVATKQKLVSGPLLAAAGKSAAAHPHI